MIVFLVYKSNNEKVDLVSPDYYAQELKFQDKIDGQNNMNSLSGKVEYTAKNQTVELKFPAEFFGKITAGEILFYRPSDAALDIKGKLSLDSLGRQKITNSNFKRGVYRMEIKCALDKKQFYFEEQIFMN